MTEPPTAEIFSKDDELIFKQRFAIQFIANWAAINYSDFCTRGLHKELHTPPIEDAIFLAQKSWDHLVDTVGLAE